jgi:hypothetical protein
VILPKSHQFFLFFLLAFMVFLDSLYGLGGPLASAFILAEDAAGVVSSTVWREAQSITRQRKAPATNSMCVARMD